ncbi:MAG: carboxymuconolactone decarboxylase family protein [Acinetobacter sp.]|nr:carboxymuconolactone decarboxylase family protein [Acinetobacter sp.]
MSSDLLQPVQGWLSPMNSRLTPPAPSERGITFRAVSALSSFFGRSQVPDIFTVMNINPGLFWPWLLFASRLMPFGRLSGREREQLILRTAWNCRSRYEWGQHVEIAFKVGVTDEEIIALTRDTETMTDKHMQTLMLACDELCEQNQISDATWAVLAKKYNEKYLIEIMLLVGHYRMIAGFLNSSGLQLEPTIEAVLQQFHQRAATILTPTQTT